MIRFILILFTGLVASFFLFPFNLPINVVVNTKMILAVIGTGLCVLDKLKAKSSGISRYFFILTLICVVISIWAFFCAVSYGAFDNSFATYFVSVWVWLGAAYSFVWMIRAVHNKITIKLICNYLIGVCVAQCLLAYAMSIWPPLEAFINGLMGEGAAFMSATKERLHGLGAALDPAGLRFSAILVIIAFLLADVDFDNKTWLGVLYLISFGIITIIGNMIARTTTVGALLSIVVFVLLRWPHQGKVVIDRSWLVVGGSLLAVIILSAWLYNHDAAFHRNLRFGFEGFFSLFEKGRWEVRSNDILKGMIIWPESLKTWLIGDGFFENPGIPDRFGIVYRGYYMGTDIGYLRFIYYFGCVGLLGMVSAFVFITYACICSFPEYKWMFLSLLLVNLIGWLKVSSDIIMVFAPFLIFAFIKQSQSIPCTSYTT